ncbi:hypothetical protein GT042_01125, partial [Streptomyces sp. SID3212]|nr:hypothetical protein [Streptomyces sp. SID3212]
GRPGRTRGRRSGGAGPGGPGGGGPGGPGDPAGPGGPAAREGSFCRLRTDPNRDRIGQGCGHTHTSIGRCCRVPPWHRSLAVREDQRHGSAEDAGGEGPAA